MAILPTRIIEWEFDAGTWTDVTADLVAVETNRGRNRELGSFETGSMVLTLRNDGRKYDPDHTAGTYYGKLRPNRRMRFRATYSAVTYPVIVGYVDKITQVSGGPNDGAAQVEVSDLFKLLNRAELPTSAYAAEVLTDTPTHWWRMGDPAGSTSLADTVGGISATLIAGTLGTAGLLVRDADTALTVPGGTAAGAVVTPSSAWIRDDAAQEHAVEFLVRFSAFPAAGHLATLWGQNNGPTGTRQTNLYVDSGGVLKWEIVGASGLITGPTLALNTTYHIVAQAGTTGGTWTNELFVNGASVGTTTFGTLNGGPLLIAAADPNIGDAPTAIVDEFAVYAARLSAARVLAHYNASITPWRGDLPGTRIGRILDLAAVPAADRNLDAGTTTLQSTSLGGTALAYAQKVEETELGELVVTRDGKVRFIGRLAAVSGAYLTSQATLVDDDSGAGIPYLAGPAADVSESVLITRSTVSRDGGIAVRYYDAAAKAEFGWLDDTHDGLLHDSEDYSQHYAQWMVNGRKTPATRIGTVTLELTANPAAMYPAILALELGDQVTYKRKPQNVGAVITLPMRVERIAHSTGAGYWRTSLQLSPFGEAGGAMPWILGDTTYSVLGTTTRPGF